jgi:hypothetical protein
MDVDLNKRNQEIAQLKFDRQKKEDQLLLIPKKR